MKPSFHKHEMMSSAIIPVETFKNAEFTVQLFQDVRPVTGIVVLVPGSNADGRHSIYDHKWREFCQRNNMALMGVKFVDLQPDVIEGYADAKVESGAALLKAIDIFDKSFPILRLADAKLYLWGFSAGGQFCYEFNAHWPAKVAAFCLNKGGIYYTALCSPEARQNPGMFFMGNKDAAYRRHIIQGLYAVNYVAGARWDLVEEPCAHDIFRSEVIGKDFFQKVCDGAWIPAREQRRLTDG